MMSAACSSIYSEGWGKNMVWAFSWRTIAETWWELFAQKIKKILSYALKMMQKCKRMNCNAKLKIKRTWPVVAGSTYRIKLLEHQNVISFMVM